MIHIAILGVGSIAEKMAQTLNGMEGKDKEFCCYGAASRDRERAEAFAAKYGFEKAYGSYEAEIKFSHGITAKLTVIVSE